MDIGPKRTETGTLGSVTETFHLQPFSGHQLDNKVYNALSTKAEVHYELRFLLDYRKSGTVRDLINVRAMTGIRTIMRLRTAQAYCLSKSACLLLE